MNLFRIDTTGNSEEDLVIATTISAEDIYKFLHPIVQAERDGGDGYDNDDLVQALRLAFPSDKLEHLNHITDTIII